MKRNSALLVLAALSAAGFAWGAPLPGSERREVDPEVLRALQAAGGMGSIHNLVLRASTMAKEWSPGAALYSILGYTPRNAKLWEPEKWTLIFGDPETRNGAFEIVFYDGAIHTRMGIKDTVRMKEFFKDGKYVGRRASLVEWQGIDYDHCRPIAPKFMDSDELAKIIDKLKLRPAAMDQYRMALLNPRDNHCDGLGYLSQFITEKPIPKRLRKKSLWILTGADETVFLHAGTGRRLHRRPRAGSPSIDEPLP